MSGPFTPNGILTLTTDFGTGDGYVGAMKGVIASAGAASGVRLQILDIAHDVPPQSIVHGGLTVDSACRYFPAGTVHVVVVDPGVGSAREAIVALAGGHCFVAPDNGVLSLALEGLGGATAAVRITRDLGRPTSATFHGRDIFAPAGAAIAAGQLSPSQLGPEQPLLTELNMPQPKQVAEGFLIRVIAADHFGNCLTNLKLAAGADLPRAVMLPDASHLPMARTYSNVEEGAPLALVGSSGWLEVAVRNGNARQQLGLETGATLLALT